MITPWCRNKCRTQSSMKMVIADQQAQAFMSPQVLNAFSKAVIEELGRTNALRGAMASAMEGPLSNVATRQDVVEVHKHLQGADLSSAVMLSCIDVKWSAMHACTWYIASRFSHRT